VPNQVTLTFAGDTAPVERSFDQVGEASERMTVRVTEGVNATAEKFDYLSSQSSLLSGGIGDVGGALTEAFGENNPIGQFGAQMEKASAIIMGFTGLMDLAVFATNNFKVATLAKAAADKTAAAAQWVMNSALFASPVTWIIAAIIALIAVIVLIAKKTDWFSQAWRASWRWIKSAASSTWDYIRKIPGWVGSAFSKVADFISRPFRSAFNYIARAWNNTIGRLSWTVPGWVPGIGGNSISVPNLPTFHSGGIVPGVPGTPTMVMALAGERVQGPNSSRADGGQWVAVRGDAVIDALTRAIADRVSARGGRPAQLGIRMA
jgi:hypothetical protein